MQTVKLKKKRAKVVVLVGLPGCGKSWYAEKLSKEGYIVINQDTLKTRDACIMQVLVALSKNQNVVIDRCNVTKSQRKWWISLAKERKAQLECVLFEPHVDLSCQNAEKRKGHPNFPTDPDKIESIIRKFYESYEPPTEAEGFESITRRLTYYPLSRYFDNA